MVGLPLIKLTMLTRSNEKARNPFRHIEQDREHLTLRNNVA